MKKTLLAGLSTGVMLLAMIGAASASTVNWTDWQTVTASAPGVIGSMGGVTVTYTGNYAFVQLGDGTGDTINYWTETSDPSKPKPYTGNTVIDNAPTPVEMIALNSLAHHTITFSQEVLNPVMAIVSMGQPGLPVSYSFDHSFSLLSNGVGYWSEIANNANPGSYIIDGNKLTGSELHAAIQFSGLITSISWDSNPSEYWHGITVGAPVPEPATMLLFGTGIAGLAAVGRRKRS